MTQKLLCGFPSLYADKLYIQMSVFLTEPCEGFYIIPFYYFFPLICLLYFFLFNLPICFNLSAHLYHSYKAVDVCLGFLHSLGSFPVFVLASISILHSSHSQFTSGWTCASRLLPPNPFFFLGTSTPQQFFFLSLFLWTVMAVPLYHSKLYSISLLTFGWRADIYVNFFLFVTLTSSTPPSHFSVNHAI